MTKTPTKIPKEKTQLEAFLTETFGEPVREYIFHPTRKWRIDYAYPEERVGIEYQGIMFGTVGHNSLGGILRDSEKLNNALAEDWVILHANAKNVGDKSFFDLVKRVIKRRSIRS